jgi:hypothetical protein
MVSGKVFSSCILYQSAQGITRERRDEGLIDTQDLNILVLFEVDMASLLAFEMYLEH